jgi:gas vesicle protein
MTVLLLDTLRLSRTLRDKGNFTSEQAEALAEALSEASQGDLASKADLAPVRSEIGDLKTELKTEIGDVRSDLKTAIVELKTGLKAEIAELRTELKDEIAGSRAEVKTEIASAATEQKTEIAGLRTELKTEIAELRAEFKAEIAQTKTALLKWILGAIGLQAIVILGVLISIFMIIPKPTLD